MLRGLFWADRLHAFAVGSRVRAVRTTRQSGATDIRTGVGHDQLLRVTVPLGYVYVPSIERIPFGLWSLVAC